MKKILITGGAGFVGYFLAKRLLEIGNVEITILDNLQRGRKDDDLDSLLSKENISFINGDLTDGKTFKRLEKNFNYIYHLAAVIGVRNVQENPDRVLFVNAISTLYLIEFCRECENLQKVFFSSTSEIYAGTLYHYDIPIPTPEDVNLTLLDVSSQRTSYMLSKMYGESIFFNYGQKYDIPFTIVRYHNVYGPRMGFMHIVPEMFVKITENEIVDVASPLHTRAMCYIDDAVEMTILACESCNTNGEILNIGNQEQEISVRELVSTISKVLQKQVEFNEIEDTPGSPSRRCPDISKIKNLTGFSPKVCLFDGISKTYDWYKSRLHTRHE